MNSDIEISQTQAFAQQTKQKIAACLLFALFVVHVLVLVIFPYLNVHELLIC